MSNVPDIIFDGPTDALMTIALAHGAGAAMDSEFMQTFAAGLARVGFRVARFEFPYMAEHRATGHKKPPNRTPVLIEIWHTVIDTLNREKLIIGGKSMGGRIASVVAEELEREASSVRGLVCLGYPFRAQGKPLKPERINHLAALHTPTLICQGERDTFGGIKEVPSYPLSDAVSLYWLADGDHDFKPRKTSGRSKAQNWSEAIVAIAEFAARL